MSMSYILIPLVGELLSHVLLVEKIPTTVRKRNIPKIAILSQKERLPICPQTRIKPK